jgi:hypothetical protein
MDENNMTNAQVSDLRIMELSKVAGISRKKGEDLKDFQRRVTVHAAYIDSAIGQAEPGSLEEAYHTARFWACEAIKRWR